MKNEDVNFDYDASQAGFMTEVQRILVQQDDYRGMGGHGPETHGPHGEHQQVSIGMGNTTVNFRQLSR